MSKKTKKVATVLHRDDVRGLLQAARRGNPLPNAKQVLFSRMVWDAWRGSQAHVKELNTKLDKLHEIYDGEVKPDEKYEPLTVTPWLPAPPTTPMIIFPDPEQVPLVTEPRTSSVYDVDRTEGPRRFPLQQEVATFKTGEE